MRKEFLSIELPHTNIGSIQVGILVVFLVVALPLFGANSTHCSAEEVTYFNCTIKKNSKVASLCGRSDNGVRYLQYRFGRPGETLELVVPATKTDPVMGRKFFFDYGVTVDDSHADTGVWFRNRDAYYELNYSQEFDGEGNVTGTESGIWVWIGTPKGAPRSLACIQPEGGRNLESASDLIQEMAPSERGWRLSPLDWKHVDQSRYE